MAVEKIALITAGDSGVGANEARRRAADMSSLISWLAFENIGYVTGQNPHIGGGLARAV